MLETLVLADFSHSGYIRPMVTINVQSDIAQALARLSKLEPRQLPFIVSLAMNKTMKQVRIDEQKEIQRAFDRPTAYTLNSLRSIPATKESLEASITFKDMAGRGVPAGKYLNEEIYGGARRDKKLDRALIALGVMPASMFAVPTGAAPLDGNGNISGQYARQLIRVLQGRRRGGKNPDAAFRAVGEGENLPPGIYARNGRKLSRVIAFTKVKAYHKRLRFFEVAEETLARVLVDETRKAAEYAISTSNTNIGSGDIAAAIGAIAGL